MSETTIMVDQDLCIQCGACVALCASAAVYAETEAGIEAVESDACWLCGHCVAACPSDAITHSEYPLDRCPAIEPAGLPSLEGLVAAFRERRSARIFQERPVPRSVVRQLVDASRWVPSAANRQAVDWLAFDEPARIAELGAMTVDVLADAVREGRRTRKGAASTSERRWDDGLGTLLYAGAGEFLQLARRWRRGEDLLFYHAPVVLVAHVPESDYLGRDDAVYAAYNLMLAAQRLGLGTCQIGYFQIALDASRRLQAELGLAGARRAEVTIALGYPEFPFQRMIPRRRPRLEWGE